MGPGASCCPAACLTASPLVSVLFAAEDPLRHLAGPPLSAQPSHPCSTRLGACSQGVLVHLRCQSFSGLGPSAAPGPPVTVLGLGSPRQPDSSLTLAPIPSWTQHRWGLGALGWTEPGVALWARAPGGSRGGVHSGTILNKDPGWGGRLIHSFSGQESLSQLGLLETGAPVPPPTCPLRGAGSVPTAQQQELWAVNQARGGRGCACSFLAALTARPGLRCQRHPCQVGREPHPCRPCFPLNPRPWPPGQLGWGLSAWGGFGGLSAATQAPPTGWAPQPLPGLP